MGCGCAGSTRKGQGPGSQTAAATQAGGGAVGNPQTFYWNGPKRPAADKAGK